MSRFEDDYIATEIHHGERAPLPTPAYANLVLAIMDRDWIDCEVGRGSWHTWTASCFAREAKLVDKRQNEACDQVIEVAGRIWKARYTPLWSGNEVAWTDHTEAASKNEHQSSMGEFGSGQNTDEEQLSGDWDLAG